MFSSLEIKFIQVKYSFCSINFLNMRNKFLSKVSFFYLPQSCTKSFKFKYLPITHQPKIEEKNLNINVMFIRLFVWNAMQIKPLHLL